MHVGFGQATQQKKNNFNKQKELLAEENNLGGFNLSQNNFQPLTFQIGELWEAVKTGLFSAFSIIYTQSLIHPQAHPLHC